MQRRTFKNVINIVDSIESVLVHSNEANTGTTPDEPFAMFDALHAAIESGKPMSTRQRRRFNVHVAKLDEASDNHAYMLVSHSDSDLTDEERRSTYECLTGGKDYPG